MKKFTDILNEYNLRNHNVQITSLFEHRGELTGSCTSAREFRKSRFSKLNEHRGEPDPQNVRQRQQAHKRGEERHKNAEERRKEEQKSRLQREREHAHAQSQIDKQRTKNFKSQQDLKRQQQLNNLKVIGQQNKQEQSSIKQRLEQIKQQKEQQKQQEQRQQQIKQNQQKKEQLQTTANEKESALEQEFVDIQATAPTESSKDSIESLTKDVKDINNEIKADLEKEIDESKRAEKRKEIEDKYNEALEKAEKDLKTSEEKAWMRESAKKVFDKANEVFDAWWELFGFKDITEPVKDVAKKYLGVDLSLKNKLQKTAKENDKKAEKQRTQKTKKSLEELGNNKKQRLQELKKQGYSDIEAQQILADIMHRRTNSDDVKQWKEKKQKKTDKKINSKQQDEQDQQLQKQQKQKNSSNYVNSLKNLATDTAGKKYVNDRIRNREKIIKEKMKENGYSYDVAEKLWYKETKNNL